MAHRATAGAGTIGTVEVMQLQRLDGLRSHPPRAVTSVTQISTPRSRKDTFVATLGHELRQPLSALLAAVEVLQLGPDAAVTSRVTTLMRRQIEQMTRVVDDLLDQTRWAHGKLTLRKARIDIRHVIRDAVLDIEAAVAARAHALSVDVPSVPVWVDADGQRLQQVLGNLLQNAVKYTEPGGRITLACECDAAAVTVRVRDTGRGIEPDALTRIFDLFAQLRPADANGLGIGLSVVREIVAQHHGQIDARSDGAGKGSEFVVVLPAATAAESRRR